MNTAIEAIAATIPVSENRAAHPFERAGLGVAPFKFVGMVEKTYQACHGAPIQPGASCDYCGTGIRYCCQIVSADGKRFVVGCDCITKIHDETNRKLTDVIKMEGQMRAAQRKIAATQRATKAAGNRGIVDEALANEDSRAKLAALPHPLGFGGKSLLSWVEWMAKHSGAAGTAKICKALKSAGI